MTARPATALRFGLNLLLGICLAVQATAALAMGASMALALAADAPSVDVATAAADRAPCHGLEAPRGTDEPPSAPACCVDGGVLCEWACGKVPPLAIPRIVLPAAERPPGPAPADARPVLPWPVSSLLRPPIG
ncbi:hypothetical protein GCM10028794_00680 [Silanimonas algicola]